MKLSINKYTVYRYTEFTGTCMLKIETTTNDKPTNKTLFDFETLKHFI